MEVRARVVQSWQKIGTMVANFILLNILWIICSLPIITIIPSFVAMLDTVRRWMIHGEEGVIGAYFYSWKRHCIRSYILGIPVLFIAGSLYLEISFYARAHNPFSLVMLALCIGFSIVFLSILVYLAPIFVSFKISAWSAVKLSAALGIRRCFVSAVSVFPVWLTIVVLLFVVKVAFVAGFIPAAIWLHLRMTRKEIKSLGQKADHNLIYDYL